MAITITEAINISDLDKFELLYKLHHKFEENNPQRTYQQADLETDYIYSISRFHKENTLEIEWADKIFGKGLLAATVAEMREQTAAKTSSTETKTVAESAGSAQSSSTTGIFSAQSGITTAFLMSSGQMGAGAAGSKAFENKNDSERGLLIQSIMELKAKVEKSLTYWYRKVVLQYLSFKLDIQNPGDIYEPAKKEIENLDKIQASLRLLLAGKPIDSAQHQHLVQVRTDYFKMCNTSTTVVLIDNLLKLLPKPEENYHKMELS